MTSVHDFCNYLELIAPCRLAEEWDNVGLIVGDRSTSVQKVMTCLTITRASAEEAIAEGVGLIVAHHPLPFRPLKRLTSDDTTGRLLLQLIQAGIAVYSPHTAFDSATAGINQLLAEGIGLQQIVPLDPLAEDPDELGTGRRGELPQSLSFDDLIQRTKAFLRIDAMKSVGEGASPIRFVAVACGSAGQFLSSAHQAGCDALLLGETSFHTCLEAEALGIRLLLPGHYASERFAIELLASELAEHFPNEEIWASRRESDPLRWV